MAKYNFDDIYRTYDGKHVNLSATLKQIHKTLFENSLSNKNKDDAVLLTKFFQTIKNLSNGQTVDEAIAAQILNENIRNKFQGIDFTKGGRGKGGVAFEQELLKLFNNIFSNVKGENFISGQTKSAVYIQQGKEENEISRYVINDILTDAEGKLKLIKQELEKDIIISGKPPLRLTKKVDGKIDLQVSSQAKLNIKFELKGTDLEKALNLIKNSSFSIKSYKTSNAISLGSTKKINAISAVAEYVAEKTGNSYIRYAATFYNAHPNKPGRKSNKKNENPSALTQLYNHYNHMRNVYELTGIGLRVDELSNLSAVDFLLINRASTNDIKVYATSELIQKMKNENKYKNH